MNKIYIFFLLFSNLIFSQANQQNEINKLNRKIIEKDSLIAIITDQTRVIKSNNEILTQTLDANDKIFSGLSTYFSVISILVSIIVIAIPVLNYFLVLRPNQDTIKKLENLEQELPNKIDKDFGNYLENFEKRKAKSLIENLNNETIDNFTNYFFLSDFSDFDDEDQNKIIEFLKKNPELESTDRLIIHAPLRRKPSLISESFYKDEIINEDKNNYKYAIEYLLNNEPEKNIKFWETIILASENGHTILMDIFEHLYKTYLGSPFDKKTTEKKKLGESVVKLFFNNETICKAVEQKPLPEKFKHSDNINANVINWNPFLEDTLYIKNNFVGKSRKKSSS